MAILHERTEWAKPRAATETRRSSDLTPEEQANVRKAIHVLRRRLGGYKALASALRVNLRTLIAQGGKRAPSAAVAIRAARLAGVPVDNVLSGAWPKAGACPHCGRCGA